MTGCGVLLILGTLRLLGNSVFTWFDVIDFLVILVVIYVLFALRRRR